MTKLFVYDNDVRRYRPDPNEPDEDLMDTTEIEDTIGKLRKIDIGDAYLDGEQNHVALRFRAIPNIKGLPTRDQEHFGYWIVDEASAESEYTGIPKGLRTLFESEGWEFPDHNTNDKKDTAVTNPQRLIEIWEQRLGMVDTESEPDQNPTMDIESGANTLRSLEIASGKSLTLGVPSFDDALELLIELRDASVTIVVGDLNRPKEVGNLDPDIILKYDEEYQYFEQLDSYAKQKLSNVVSEQVANSINNSLNRLREESDDWKAEIVTITKILSALQEQGVHQDPKTVARSLSPDDFPKPARGIPADLKKLHQTYDFDRQQHNLKRTYIPSIIYDPQSPYDELASQLENRLEYIETEIYKTETESIVSIDNIQPSITYIADQLGEDKAAVRDELFSNIGEIIKQNMYQSVTKENPNLFKRIRTNPRYLLALVLAVCFISINLGIFLATSFAIPPIWSLI